MKKVLLVMALALPLIGGVSWAADFDGDSRDDIAIFRPSTGLWAVRGVTRAYFGGSSDTPAAGDYDGDGVAEIGIFRGSTGLWAIRGVTRAYFGESSDIPVTGGGGGQRTYDYVVKPGDAADLVQALESDTHRSVFIPDGSYNVNTVINVDNVRQITGESMTGALISFGTNAYLSIEENYCHVERISVQFGGDPASFIGNFYINANYVTIRECYSSASYEDGFEYTSDSSFIDCIATNAVLNGFKGSPGDKNSRLVNCVSRKNGFDGFNGCRNMSNCSVYDVGQTGFYSCSYLSSCFVDDAGDDGFWLCENLASCGVSTAADDGYYGCNRLSSCSVDGATYGFRNCAFLSSCTAASCSTAKYSGCWRVDTDSCD